MSVVELDSVLTCPHCGFAARETMPTDACQFFYECRKCKTVLRPKLCIPTERDRGFRRMMTAESDDVDQ